MNTTYNTVDEYLNAFPADIRNLLEQIRRTIRQTTSEAEESISYGMPAYKLNGKPLVYFAAFRNHIGFYATPTGHKAFAGELSRFKHGKGSVQFPLSEPLPLELIARIVAFRTMELTVPK